VCVLLSGCVRTDDVVSTSDVMRTIRLTHPPSHPPTHAPTHPTHPPTHAPTMLVSTSDVMRTIQLSVWVMDSA
jgi:hypothetical protein